jgi:hypothetical protein
MSKVEESDKGMRVIAIIGGIIAIIEAILILTGNGLMSYGFGMIGTILIFVFAIITIVLGIRPIRGTPFFLAVLGILLIVFASLIGGIFILLATFIGFLS